MKRNGFAALEISLVLVVVTLLGIAATFYFRPDIARVESTHPRSAKVQNESSNTASNGISSKDSEAASYQTSNSFEREGTVLSETNLHNLEIIQLHSGGYRMFFHEGQKILSAYSKDGKTFEREEGTRLVGSMPAFVQLGSGSWRMYYVENQMIKSALTHDGFTLLQESGVRLQGQSGDLDQGGVIHPTVLRLPDDSFVMYYDGVASTDPQNQGPDQWTIMSATSKDGLDWVPDDGGRIPLTIVNGEQGDGERNILDDFFAKDDEEDETINGVTAAWSAHAEYANGTYSLYFSGSSNPPSRSGIWRATSTDGIDFTVDSEPVLGRESGFGDEIDEVSTGGPVGVPQDPFMLDLENGTRLFYWTPDGGILSALQTEAT